MFLFIPSIQAENLEFYKLLDMLEANGTITEKQKTKLEKAADKAVTKKNEKPQVESSGGIEIHTFDNQFSFELGGRLMIDTAYYDESVNNLGSGTELRRARIEAEGIIYENWAYEFAVDFSGTDADIKDAYLQYRNLWPGKLTLGHFKEPFSLEELTSSRYITFMERALINEIAPGRNIGVGYHTYDENWTAAFGVFGESFDDDVEAEGDEGYGLTTRFTYSPVHKDSNAVHFGVAISIRKPDDDAEIKLDARPESHLTDVKYINTGKITNIDNIQKSGLEFAWVKGPFSIQSEVMTIGLVRKGGNEDLSFNGFYVYSSWFLTGESRKYKYKKASFGRIKPINKKGAWELAVRYSSLDLNDGNISGGEEDNITLGINFYINPQLRVMANYIMVNNDLNADDDGDVMGSDDVNLLQLRLQADF